MDTETRCLLVSGMTFLAGLMLGLSTGLLYAPQSGTRTRRRLKDMVEDANECVEDWAEDAKETMSDVVKRGKKLVER